MVDNDKWKEVGTLTDRVNATLKKIGKVYAGDFKFSLHISPKATGENFLVTLTIPRAQELNSALPTEITGTPQDVANRFFPAVTPLLKF